MGRFCLTVDYYNKVNKWVCLLITVWYLRADLGTDLLNLLSILDLPFQEESRDLRVSLSEAYPERDDEPLASGGLLEG